MIDSKYFNRIIAVMASLAALFCIIFMLLSDKITDKLGTDGITLEYENKLFNTSSIIDINITIDESQWSDLLENAINEDYYSCDVTVNDTVFQNVAIRTKGNTSLSSIANDPTTDRYSFKLEFDHYIESQTCFGLDKLILNNNYADATNMKESIVYDMYKFLGADASLYNYAKISVNGQYWGVYLALEAVEDSFLLRNYGVSNGELYKPDSMNFGGAGGMKGKDNDELEEMNEKFVGQIKDQNSVPNQPPDNSMKFPGGMSGNGADLNYIDDNLDSYSTIWDGEVNSTSKKDRKRVVKALKNISHGNDLETYMDIDNLLKYMAVHTFSVNLDSLSGSMTHNYYLYEEDGKLNLIPWDYNLAWGGFQSNGENSASEAINFAIDTPFSNGITQEDRDFFTALLENEEYLETYHKYLQQLCDEYINGGHFDDVYSRIRNQIDTLVDQDPNAFYTYKEYDAAANMLCSVLSLRAESVNGQLNGIIPSTNEGQSEDNATLIISFNLDVSVMGSMNMGGKDMKTTNKMEFPTNDNALTDNSRPSPPSNAKQHIASQNTITKTRFNSSGLILIGFSLFAILAGLISTKFFKHR